MLNAFLDAAYLLALALVGGFFNLFFLAGCVSFFDIHHKNNLAGYNLLGYILSQEVRQRCQAKQERNKMTKFIGKDKNFANGTTTYWFDIDGEQFGVVESPSESNFVDCDGYPIDDGADWATKKSLSTIVITEEMRRG